MKSGFYRRKDGRERLWFSAEDVESLLEHELRKAGLYPTLENPVVDLERFIAKHLRVELDQHAELPPDELGLTEFFPNKSPRIRINRDLTNAIDADDTPLGIRGRWRATLGHEASHVIMHRVLFEVPSGQGKLFGIQDPIPGQPMTCLKRNVLFRGGSGDWREVQANMGMGALLMPSRFLRLLVEQISGERRIPPIWHSGGARSVRELIATVAASCDVSRQAAQIRLESTGMLVTPGQQCM